MNTYQEYIQEIEERKKQGLSPKPIDGSELTAEIIAQIKDSAHEHRKESLNFFIYNTLPGTTSAAEEKAALLYSVIDNSHEYFRCPVHSAYRSVMNVVFQLPTEDLDNLFLKEATEEGLVNLKGHRSVGGCRASIYNAMPRSGVEALAEFMQSFQENHPG